MVLQNKIPSIYHSLFPELLSIEFPEEQIATCDTCTLCRSVKSPYINTKCCAYHPHLANFLLGAVLTDEEKSLALGKERIRSQIKARSGVTPYGIIPPAAYSKRQKGMESKDFWSLDPEVLKLQLCPYFDKGNCTVWKYRENLCVTHFCSSVGGSAGNAFWKKVNRYLKMAETTLSQYTMLQTGYSPVNIKTNAVTSSDFDLEDENGLVKNEVYSKLWGEWEGKEEEFYKSCYRVIIEMDASTFKRISGISREILEAAIRDTQNKFLQNVLPEILLFNSNAITEPGTEAGHTRLVLGEASAEIPTVLFPLIRGFNGKRSTVTVFQLGYNLLFNLSEIVDELRGKGILITV